MNYPTFLSPNDRIAITAPSAGAGGDKLQSLLFSEAQLKHYGFSITESASVRNTGIVSDTGCVRAAELTALFEDPGVRLILCATGGDFLIDILPYFNFDTIRRNPKWLQGYSDPTNLLYSITTKCDIATIYGTNGGGFDMEPLHPSLQYNIGLWQGNIPKQCSFDRYVGEKDSEAPFSGYALTNPVEWQTPNGTVDATGRLLGGCMDCLNDLIGTKYDATEDFVRRYRADGIIWYFDVFALRAEAVHNTLWHMREAGWFENARAFLFGRVRFPGTLLDMRYETAIRRAIGSEVPLVLDADIGHVAPRMTVINGAMAHLTAGNGCGSLSMVLK